MQKQTKNRIFGLDILRSLAIIIVVLGHSEFPFIKDFLKLPLPDGVDLFFVLSGFLVGSIIIKDIEKNEKYQFKQVSNFLKRRWYRTLPNYFLFLLINIILINFGLIKGVLNKYLITFFVFFQNFFKPFDFLFWESWSLSVEEWFYLSFPIIIFILFTLTKFKIKKKNIVLTSIFIIIIFPFLFRLYKAYSYPHLDFDLYFRKLVLTRLDTIGFGILGAYINFYHQSFWNKFKNYFFVLGISLLSFLIIHKFSGFFLKTFYYSLIGLSILFVLPILQNLKNETIPFNPIRFISKISYSMYLLHLPLMYIFIQNFPVSNKLESLIIYICFWLVLILFSFLIYNFYEKPLMDLRDKNKK